MGNKLARRRQVVDEKYTRPQGLYQHRDVDHKKLRKLILDSKLAPCYPGDEETAFDLEECPICFLYYPSLNRSRCCTKGICTECFLQMKTPNSTRPTQCPFCKTSNYAVEYRGVKSKEEKGKEQIEEQRVIEAKIRMRQKEILDDEEMIQKRQEDSSTSQILVQEDVQCSSSQSVRSRGDGVEIVSSHASTSMIRHPPRLKQNRDEQFDLDLEDIMVMEAIWLSIQESGRQKNVLYCSDTAPKQVSVDCSTPNVETSSSPSGGLACAIAALAERQQTSGESSTSCSGHTGAFHMPSPCGNRFSQRIRPSAEDYPLGDNAIDENQMMAATEEDTQWGLSQAATLGNNYTIPEATVDTNEISGVPPLPLQENGSGFQTIIPESFEEQMMLAMAVSLAEARARTNSGVVWQ